MKVFLNHLKAKDIKSSPTTPSALKAFADEVAEFVGSQAKCEILLGGILSDGQEYRCVLSCPALSYAQTLFRVYVSLKDQNISFQPAGEEIEKNVKDLSERLMKFLEVPAVIETLQHIKTSEKKKI